MMNIYEFVRYPEKIPCDKRIHFMIGSVIMSIITMFTINIVILSVSLLFVAYGIEVFQNITKSGNFDHYDALFVILGGLVVIIPVFLQG